jgi:hypothetical protein
VLAALLVAGGARAEVAGRPGQDGRVDFLVMGPLGITDGVDPIPQVWTQYRPLPSDWVLNPSGDAREDGRPDIAFRRPEGTPVVVWAYNHGESHDIAIATWEADGWGPVELITNTAENEVDPRVFVLGDGTTLVTWWVEGPDTRVEVTTRAQDGDTWAAPQRVTELNEPGARPSIAFHGGAVWVAYERDATENVFNTREVAVRRQSEAGTFVLEFVAESEYDGPLEPVLHVKPGKFWMDWRYSEDEYAYAEIDGTAGSSTSLESCTDPSWIGVESVRRLIAKIIGPATPDQGDPTEP